MLKKHVLFSDKFVLGLLWDQCNYLDMDPTAAVFIRLHYSTALA